jgi:hypothetical protein
MHTNARLAHMRSQWPTNYTLHRARESVGYISAEVECRALRKLEASVNI